MRPITIKIIFGLVENDLQTGNDNGNTDSEDLSKCNFQKSPPSRQLVPGQQQIQVGLAGQMGRRQSEPLEASGVGRQGWSGLHLGSKKEKTPRIVKVRSPENIGGMVGGMKPLFGGGAISA